MFQNIPRPVVVYAALGALAASMLAKGRGRKVGKLTRGALLGAALALAAPTVGVALPGLPLPSRGVRA